MKSYATHKILKDVLADLRVAIGPDVSGLDFDLYLGLHNQTVPSNDRIKIGIQTEHLLTDDGAAGWMDVDADILRGNIRNCTFIIDFSSHNKKIYDDIGGGGAPEIIIGPYVFPVAKPVSCGPTHGDPLFVGTLKKRINRAKRLENYTERCGPIQIEEKLFGVDLNAAIKNAAAVVNVHNVPSVITELPRFLKAYLNGNILLSEPLDAPFIADRHYIDITNAQDTLNITIDQRAKIIDNIHADFMPYRIGPLLAMLVKRHG